MKKYTIQIFSSQMLLAIWLFASPIAPADEGPAKQPSLEKQMQEVNKKIARGESQKAVTLLDKIIQAKPDLALAHYMRGRENFKIGQIEKSVSDFDQYVKLRPDREKSLWERGISHYYAKMFKQGNKQFELYQTFHDNDVENSVWRYLCMARAETPEKARRVMLPIKNDTRVPMMQIYDLYRGQLKPQDVLTAATDPKLTDDQSQRGLFYAHLYLGLYYESSGKRRKAIEHLDLAADKYKIENYMWNVARVHADRIHAAKKTNTTKKKP